MDSPDKQRAEMSELEEAQEWLALCELKVKESLKGLGLPNFALEFTKEALDGFSRETEK